MLGINSFRTRLGLATAKAGVAGIRQTQLPLIRHASMISSPNDPKLVGLLSRLDKFDKKSKIFDKLDSLYLLTQRKGFFNLNANNLEFTSNNNKISDTFSNLYNFNDLNRIVSSHYSSMLLLPSGGLSASPGSLGAAGSAADAGTALVPATAMLLPNAPLMAGGGASFGSFNRNANNGSVDKYRRLLNGLAKNDVEMKNRIESVLRAFDNEDDFFFNYVLEFWISGKSFNKLKARKLEEEQQGGSAPSNVSI